MSVKRWLRSRPTTTATMIPVRVIAAAVDRAQTEALVTVTTPNGLRVDGLQFDALCTLIARFG